MFRGFGVSSHLFSIVAILAVSPGCCQERPASAQESTQVVDVARKNVASHSTGAKDARHTKLPKRHLSQLEQVLLDSAGGQYGAYAELLLTFSDDGRLPLFHERVDLGDDDPSRAIENYKKLTELTDRLIEQRDSAREVTKQFSNESKSPQSMDDFWSQRLFEWMPSGQVSLLMIESLLEPGWKFWSWAENARKRARADVLGIAYADPEKNKIHPGEQKMLRERIYQVAKKQFGEDPNVGGSEVEFYQNLKDGKLDHLSQRIHAEMSQDATDAGLTYMTVAATQGKRPIDKVYEEGCQGLKNGVDLYVAAGKATVTGGLGPSAGKHFEKGWDKAKDACEKIEEAEKEYKEFKEDPAGYLKDKVTEKVKEKVEDFATKKGEELFDHARKNIKGFAEAEDLANKAKDVKDEVEAAAEDPSGYLLGKVDEKFKIGERVKKFVKDKTNLSDETIEFLGDKVSENVMEMGRNVVFGEMVDKELKKAGGDPKKAEMKSTLRRIKDADWDMGAVAVPEGSSGDSGSGSSIVVWQDPDSGEVKTTLQPVATGGDDVIPVPGDSKATVMTVDDEGDLAPVTDKPITVESDQVVSIDSDEGTTEVVSYDDYFEDDTTDSLVDTNAGQVPGSFTMPDGGLRVDLSQLYPPSDESDDVMEIRDYDADSSDTWGDDFWGDEWTGDPDMTDDIVDADNDNDSEEDGVMDWPSEDEEDWGSDDEDEVTDNIAEIPEETPKKRNVPNIKPSSKRFLPQKCKIEVQAFPHNGVRSDPVVFTIDGNKMSGTCVSRVESMTRPGCDFYGYKAYAKISGTIEGNVVTELLTTWHDPNRSRHYSTNREADQADHYDYISTITTESPPIRGRTLLSEDGKWASHLESYSYKWMMRQSGKLAANQKSYMEETYTTEPWSWGGTWRYVE